MIFEILGFEFGPIINCKFCSESNSASIVEKSMKKVHFDNNKSILK